MAKPLGIIRMASFVVRPTCLNIITCGLLLENETAVFNNTFLYLQKERQPSHSYVKKTVDYGLVIKFY
jgi:hypothetical protein